MDCDKAPVVSHPWLPMGPAETETAPVWSANFLQQIGLVQFASDPGYIVLNVRKRTGIELCHTVYDRSMCTSLKCTTRKGVFPLEVKILGVDGAAFGKVTVYAFTEGASQSPIKALQNLVAVWPETDMWRNLWATMGPCC